MYLYAWWSLGFKVNWEIDLAVQLLRNPVSLSAYLAQIMQEHFNEKPFERRLDKFKVESVASRLHIKLGECRESREQE